MEREATYRITDFSVSDRPRERIAQLGSQSLSNAELIAILLRTGSPGENAIQVGQRLLQAFGGLSGLHRATFTEICAQYGIGEAKAAQIKAAIFCRFDGAKLRAIFTDRYTAIDHTEILSRMVEYGFTSETEVHYSLDRDLLVLKVPDFTRVFGFEQDRIIPGISVANSEVGILAFSIEAYFFRIVCCNGLIAKTAVASRYRHVSRKALEQFPDTLRQVVYESERNQGRFAISAQTRVDNPLATIGSFNRQFTLTKK